jgi:hypothetical protein
MKLQDVRNLLDRAGFKYFLSPQQDAVLVGVVGLNSRYQFVVHLPAEGNFLQFLSVGFLRCDAKNPYAPIVFKAIADMNYAFRGVKIGWDERDGELAVYSDIWVLDGTVTYNQFTQTMFGFMQILDVAYQRISRILSSGVDPGTDSIEQMLKTLMAGGAAERLPRELADLLKKGAPGADRDSRTRPERNESADDFSEI